MYAADDYGRFLYTDNCTRLGAAENRSLAGKIARNGDKMTAALPCWLPGSAAWSIVRRAQHYHLAAQAGRFNGIRLAAH